MRKFSAILILAASARGQSVPVIAPAEAQSPALGAPAFEVATIKPSKAGTPGNGVGFRGSQFIAVNTSFKDLLKFAFDLHSRQIGGGPSWLDSDSFDIIAKPEGEGRPSGKQLEAMVQKLLATSNLIGRPMRLSSVGAPEMRCQATILERPRISSPPCGTNLGSDLNLRRRLCMFSRSITSRNRRRINGGCDLSLVCFLKGPFLPTILGAAGRGVEEWPIMLDNAQLPSGPRTAIEDEAL